MKKYFIFIGSFILLLAAYQIGTGLWLTSTYEPGSSTQSIAENMTLVNSVVLLVSASIAFLLSQIVGRRSV
ncbi:hypothetical protein KP77_08930 [Jeotgalibacillus alimentarius]|uniref:Uncharacterized protein n=1 Tax=Jeotgalibacillus alimentarius TaxID=135826 RepID=A0A0C2W447_9BACL|nr:hypothetical protein [Jeotgalibacillus alimentarius]KIL51381.1 hypothetical protein KP77_08930 [Jeotgalibacillus alimentarius]